MTFPKLSEFIHFSKTFPGLEIVVLKFHDFSRFFMTVRTLPLRISIQENKLTYHITLFIFVKFTIFSIQYNALF